MADFTLSGDLSKQAQNHVQTGLNATLYFFLQSENASITFDASTREVDAITMSSGNEAYSFRANVDEALADFTMGGGSGTYGQQTLTFAIDGLTSENALKIEEYDKNTGLCALVVLANGKRLLFGVDFQKVDNSADDYNWVAKFNSAGANTSGTIADSSTTTTNRMQRTYIWNTNNSPVFVDTALSLSTLTTAAA